MDQQQSGTPSGKRRATRQAEAVAREMVGAASATVSGVASLLPPPVTHLARSSGQLIGDLPHLEAEVDVVMEQIAAQRLDIRALTAELAALERQLAILEDTLTPLQTWTHRWTDARDKLADALQRLDRLGAVEPVDGDQDETNEGGRHD
jgi:hypothetical protein